MEQLSTRVVYQNPWLTVREDAVRLDDGSDGIYGVVEKQDFAVVLARGDGGFWMVEQYRYPIRRRSWELPMGSWPEGHSGTPLELAQAELAEETGIRARTWRHLGHLKEASGYATQGFDVFLATNLEAGLPDREPGEQDMVHAFVTDEELERRIREGELVDAPSLAALLLWRVLPA